MEHKRLLKLIRTSIALAALLAAAPALSAPPAQGQAQRGPAAMQGGDFAQHMQHMQEIHNQMQTTTDASKQRQLMQEHMQAMQQGMQSMMGPGGGGMMGPGMMGQGMMGQGTPARGSESKKTGEFAKLSEEDMAQQMAQMQQQMQMMQQMMQQMMLQQNWMQQRQQ